MRIEVQEKKKNLVRFLDLPLGAVYRYMDSIFMKIQRMDAGEYNIRSILLKSPSGFIETGAIKYCADSAEVEPLEATLTIQG